MCPVIIIWLSFSTVNILEKKFRPYGLWGPRERKAGPGQPWPPGGLCKKWAEINMSLLGSPPQGCWLLDTSHCWGDFNFSFFFTEDLDSLNSGLVWNCACSAHISLWCSKVLLNLFWPRLQVIHWSSILIKSIMDYHHLMTICSDPWQRNNGCNLLIKIDGGGQVLARSTPGSTCWPTLHTCPLRNSLLGKGNWSRWLWCDQVDIDLKNFHMCANQKNSRPN